MQNKLVKQVFVRVILFISITLCACNGTGSNTSNNINSIQTKINTASNATDSGTAQMVDPVNNETNVPLTQMIHITLPYMVDFNDVTPTYMLTFFSITQVDNGSGQSANEPYNICGYDMYNICLAPTGLWNNARVTVYYNGGLPTYGGQNIPPATWTFFTIPPIALINPAVSAYNSIPDDQVFTLAVDSDVESSTLNSTTIQLWSIESNGESSLVNWAYDGVWSSDNSQITFTPSSLLAYSHNYQLVTSGIQKEDGGVLPTQIINLSTTTQPSMMQYTYIVDNATSSINMYLAESDGSLVPLSPATIQMPENGAKIEYMTVSPDNQYMYVANNAGSDIYQYSIQGNGQLKYITSYNTPLSSPSKLVFTPDEGYAYLTSEACGANESGNTVCSWIIMYSVTESSGELTLLSPSTISLPEYATSPHINANIIMDNFGQYVYTSDSEVTDDESGVYGYIDVFKINESGQLTHVNQTVSAFGYVEAMSMSQKNSNSLTAPQKLYVAAHNLDGQSNYIGNVTEYDIITRSGELTNPQSINIGYSPMSIVLTPNGQFAYIGDAILNTNQPTIDFNTIYSFAIDSSFGTLTAQSTYPLVAPPSAGDGIYMTLNTTNNFMYVLIENAFDPSGAAVATNYYQTYTIDSSGTLMQINSGTSGASKPTDLTTLAICSNGETYCY